MQTLLTIHDLAKIIHRTPGAIRVMVARGQIPHRKPGNRRLLFLSDEIQRWIEQAPGTRLEDQTR